MKTVAIILFVGIGVYVAGFWTGYAYHGPNLDPHARPDTRSDLPATVFDGGVMSDETLIRHQLFGNNYVTVPFIPEQPESTRDEGVEL